MAKKYSSYKYAAFEKMLDDWLGCHRNGDSGISVLADYNDPRVCKLSLAAYCPHFLLQKTRLAKAPCKCEVCPAPQHLREAYQRDKSNMTHPYDQALYDLLDQILTAADKRVQFSKSCRDSKASELPESPQLREMDKKIEALLTESRSCGANGDVVRARSFLDNAEIVKEQRAAKEQELVKATMETDSKVTICEICTAVIRQSDMEGRMAEHIVGRQHLAYLKMREVFETLKSGGIVGKRLKGRRSSSRPFGGMVRRLEPLD
jgi:hypothetical protein